MSPKPVKLKQTKTWGLYLKVPRGFKERILSWLMAVLDHFLKSDPFREALRKVIQKNRPQVRDLLDVWSPDIEPLAAGEDAGMFPSAAYLTNVNAGRRAVEDIVLARVAAREFSPDSPDCSVIIPVFNKDYLTYRCLRSLLLAKVSRTFEVIVIDNASSDHTLEVLEHFGVRIRVIANDENAGFVAACNQGAAASKGRFLVFLNNDTEVPRGWLDRLTETVGMFDNVGAVGAKLVYPDGTLQEAGGIIWRDASGANYGRGEDSLEPRYNYLREVDYCSGACLLVRRELFERLGGFDMRYAPAYYEDTDLCFGVRSLGYKVLYQPECEIVHYEGATAGRSLDSGFKRYQAVNREKFAYKWQEALRLQMPPSPENLNVAADRRTGPRILFMDYQVPKPDQDSGSVRIFAVMKILSQSGCRVSFMLRQGEPLDGYARALGGIGVRLVPEGSGQVWEELKAGNFDLIVISRMDVADCYLEKIKAADTGVPIIFDTVDIHFIRAMREAAISGGGSENKKALLTKEKELKIARSCDLVIAVTESDKEHLLKEDPALKVEVIPNIHDPLDIIPTLEGRSCLMFIGGFNHPPNVDAMLFFTKDVFPIIRRELGDVQLLIVGSFPPDEVMALASESITVTGYVPDTAPYFRKSRVFVSPLRYGAGMKGKIGEAMCHGVPVVTTYMGAEGMGLVDGETALIQDDPEAFAREAIRLYKNDLLWIRLATNGKRFINEHYSPNVLKEKVLVLQELAMESVKKHA